MFHEMICNKDFLGSYVATLCCSRIVPSNIALSLESCVSCTLRELCFFCYRSGQNTVELLAIADKRVAELNEQIRMLEKQVKRICGGMSSGCRYCSAGGGGGYCRTVAHRQLKGLCSGI